MRNVVSLDEFRKNLSDIIAKVMYGNQTILVQKHNKTGVIVLSEQEYENLKDPRKRFNSKEDWEKFFVLTDKIKSRIADTDQEKLERVINEEVTTVRAQKQQNAA